MRALQPTEIVTALVQLPHWRLSGEGEQIAIERDWRFASHAQALLFVNALGWLAELTNTPASQLDIQQPFHSLGLGSLQTALLLARLHTELGIVVPPAALNPDASLGELVALISAASPHKVS